MKLKRFFAICIVSSFATAVVAKEMTIKRRAAPRRLQTAPKPAVRPVKDDSLTKAVRTLVAHSGTAGTVSIAARYLHNKAMRIAKEKYQNETAALRKRYSTLLLKYDKLERDFKQERRDALLASNEDLVDMEGRYRDMLFQKLRVDHQYAQLARNTTQQEAYLNEQIVFWRKATETAEAKFEDLQRQAQRDMMRAKESEQHTMDAHIDRLANLERQFHLLRNIIPDFWSAGRLRASGEGENIERMGLINEV